MSTNSNGRSADSLWTRELAGFAGPTPLWLDRLPGRPPADGARVSHSSEVAGAAAVQAVAEQHAISLRTIYSAVWGFLLGRLTGEQDVVVGATTETSNEALPVRLSLSSDLPFGTWLQQLHERQAALLDTPTGLGRDPGRTAGGPSAEAPLFESVVSLGPGEPAADVAAAGARAALVLTVRRTERTTLVTLDADAARFDEWTVRRTLAHFLRVLDCIAAAPGQRLTEVPLLDDEERRQLVVEWNRPSPPYRPEACIHELFAEQAARHPDALAVLGRESSLTYGELDRRANQLARFLARQGIGPDVRVGLYLERTPDVLVALLGILKAGGGYMPLDFGAPADRLAFMLADAAVPLVITQASLVSHLPAFNGRSLVLDVEAEAIAREADTAPAVAVHAGHLAYVNYTSGSTGTPKGVEIVHRAVNRLVCAVDYVELSDDETLLHAAPLSFDASTFEIWGALLNGGRCALYPEAIITPDLLAATIRRHHVTTAWLTAALFNAVVDQNVTALTGLRQLLVGGEALSVAHVRQAMAALPGVQIINGYGPTETTTFAVCYRVPRPLPDDVTSIPIGRPIRDTQAYVLDARRELVPVGVAGELYLAGAGLARGYLDRPELTADKFIANPFDPSGAGRLYRTGDLVRYQPDGVIAFIGRTDSMVKIRGFRIELGEIESTLARHASVRQALVIASEDTGSGKRLVAYLVMHDQADQPSTTALREYLRATVPDYMVPSAFVWLKALPISSTGKVDRRALPKPDRERPALAAPYVAPQSRTERLLCSLFGELLAIDRVGTADGFFELGGNSLMCLQLLGRLRKDHGLDVPVVDFFRAPTPEGVARYVEAGSTPDRRRLPSRAAARQPASRAGERDRGVAVIGMAGRFPGADSVEELWRNLCVGAESITFWSDPELDPAVGDSRTHPDYVRARGVLRDVEMFDADFFGVKPKEAEVMDPQQRIFLETAWQALENAGYVAEQFAGLIGIYGGMNDSTYAAHHVAKHPEVIERVGAFQAMVGREKDYLTTRVAHRLGLTGPALTIQTACSTSLVAIAEAYFSLRSHRCDMALAGGVSITCPPRSGYLYQEGAMLSPDGHTRPFDAKAQGTVFSDGVGIVVLKRLEDAEADGDTIHAVIRGAAVNSDGADRASFSAPSTDGQAAVIAMAHACAGVDPRSISYVEAHGTATPLGDPIEIEGLTRAFRLATDDTGFCAIGSIKSNLGHLVMAAGAAGFIKTTLALAREQIPATIHFSDDNPRIDFKASPFFVSGAMREWPRSTAPRRAGVSAFGVGGTNAHVVLEEAPDPGPSRHDRPDQLLMLSARTPAALETATANLVTYLREHPSASLADVAYTLQMGRRGFAHRRVVVAADGASAADSLQARDPRRVASAHLQSKAPGVVFMFPGQGSQYVGMGSRLYQDDPFFRSIVDECAEVLRPAAGFDLRDRLDPAVAGAASAETAVVQPSLFVTEYALARLWMHWGVAPAALIGHSVGEFVCAVIANVLSLEDALRLVALRARLMQDLPHGSMLSVRLPAETLAPRLVAGVAIASANAPGLSVASGPTELIAALRADLDAEGIACRLLRTSHAFHSPMMDPVIGPFERAVAEVRLAPPALPIMSTVSATWMTAAQATDPTYWARHLRETVRFADAVQTLRRDDYDVFLEAGPGSTLTTLTKAQRSVATEQRRGLAVSSLADGPDAEWPSLLKAAGQLWLAGLDLNWPALHAGQPRRVPLPTYPFERRRYWIDAAAATRHPIDLEPSMHESDGTLKQTVETSQPAPSGVSASARKARLLAQLRQLVEETVGVEVSDTDAAATFMELGIDSLALTQTARQLQKTFGVNVTFRQLMESMPTLDALADHLDAQLPAEASPAPARTPARAAAPAAEVAAVVLPAAPERWSAAPVGAAGSLQAVIDQQLRLMSQQLALLSGRGAPEVGLVPMAAAPMPIGGDVSLDRAQPDGEGAGDAAAPTARAASSAPPVPADTAEPVPSRVSYDAKKAFGAIARIHLTTAEELTPKARARLQALVRRYNARTRQSKRLTQLNRPVLADPRVVSGFRPVIKELVYPIIVERSKGSKLWDVDGNEYVDVLCGFGSGFFGWQPDFVTAAVKDQIDRGLEIGPQHPLAGELAHAICDVTGFDRAGFCNTGSEAVMGAMRIARTVTGRDTIAIFTGSYHGIFDEVIVRGTRKLQTVPAAPGIMASACQNVLVLDYGTPESLDILRARAGELAAIMVEPVQSRRPDFQPRDFLHAVRQITRDAGALMICDEMITGFRVHPRGAQGHFDVQADLATYGKLIGGGYPIGVIAGRREYMDALDGGGWQFGDESMPTVGVTYFAGTFVRHPLALAAAKAVIDHVREHSPALQADMTAKTTQMVTELNTHFTAVGAPLEIRHFGSMWKTFYTEEQPFGDLLFVYLRDRGLHILDGFPCFLSTAHSAADIEFVVKAFKEAIAEMQESGFLPARTAAVGDGSSADAPPVPEARLGRDPDGSPAWYVPDPSQAGQYVKLSSV